MDKNKILHGIIITIILDAGVVAEVFLAMGETSVFDRLQELQGCQTDNDNADVKMGGMVITVAASVGGGVSQQQATESVMSIHA